MTLSELYRQAPVKRSPLTETQRALITLALREKADHDAKLAARTQNDRFGIHMEQQAKQALALAELIEGADALTVSTSVER